MIIQMQSMPMNWRGGKKNQYKTAHTKYNINSICEQIDWAQTGYKF